MSNFTHSTPDPYDPYGQQKREKQPKQRQSVYGAPSAAQKRNLTPWFIVGGAVTFGMLTFVGVIALILIVYVMQERILTGVNVAGVDISGQTADDAAAQLTEAFASKEITLTDADRSWRLALSALGISIDTAATMEAAKTAVEGTNVQPIYTIDMVAAQNGLMALSDQTDIDAQAGNPPKPGRAMDIPFMLDRLNQNLNGELADGVLDLTMITIEAEYDPEASYTGEPTLYTVQSGDELGLIAKKFGVEITDIVQLNDIVDPDLLYVGQELKIPAPGEFTPSDEDAPQPASNSGKAIVVSVSNQRIYAFENGELVRSHLVSTGLPQTPTVLGDYKVYLKFVADDMQGPGYFLPQVPYAMYFFQGYAIHGTYWHNKFGRPMSHGCVNLPTSEAEWFFQWAEMGTPVRVVA